MGAIGGVVVDEAGPGLLSLADHHCLCVLRDFIGTQRCMEPTHDHRHATTAIFAGDLIGTLRRVRLDADRDEVRRLVERDQFHAVVIETHVHVSGRQSREGGGGQRLHLPRADVTLPGAAADARMDDREFHAPFLAGEPPMVSETLE